MPALDNDNSRNQSFTYESLNWLTSAQTVGGRLLGDDRKRPQRELGRQLRRSLS